MAIARLAKVARMYCLDILSYKSAHNTKILLCLGSKIWNLSPADRAISIINNLNRAIQIFYKEFIQYQKQTQFLLIFLLESAVFKHHKIAETYSKPYQTFKMELLTEIKKLYLRCLTELWRPLSFRLVLLVHDQFSDKFAWNSLTVAQKKIIDLIWIKITWISKLLSPMWAITMTVSSLYSTFIIIYSTLRD